MEKIIEIIERDDDEGFDIKTNKQIINIGIEDGQYCCEEFGCVSSEDDLIKFVGASIISIQLTEKSLIKYDVDLYNLQSGGAMFIDINTNIGTFQFVCYNKHNGYYDHKAYIKSVQLTEEVEL